MHRSQITKLKDKLLVFRKSQTVRVVNQKLKRKDEQLAKLRAELRRNSAAVELGKTRRELRKSQTQLNRLKMSTVTDTETAEMRDMKTQLQSLHERIKEMENEKLTLEDHMIVGPEVQSVKPGKAFVPNIRLAVYDGIVNQVPTANIPVLISKLPSRFGVPIDSVPHRNTVEMMARELGVIARLQTAEAICHHPHVTLGFDATTQEGVHINSLHVTTESSCYVVSVDELPGGTAVDYSEHICESIDNLAKLYSLHTETNYQQCRSKLVSNISNCMTDRAAANHAAVLLVNEVWDKTLTELNCHLHPLDTIASAARSSLKRVESEKGKLFGNDCIAANLVLQLNKLRYKDRKGDPRGFKAFLDSQNLPRGFVPRYRGNRLHILFHICGKYVEQYDAVLSYMNSGTVACGGLTAAIAHDFAAVMDEHFHVIQYI